MKNFKEIKGMVNDKVEEIKSKKEENSEMNEEKKKMPKWLKIGGGVLAGAAALGGAYLFGKHNGNSDDSDYVSDFQDAMMEAAESEEF